MEANQILGVGANAGEEEIRAAYVSKVKESPPDRAPAGNIAVTRCTTAQRLPSAALPIQFQAPLLAREEVLG